MTTDKDVADKLGVHFTMVSHLRNGLSMPSWQLGRKIQQLFRIPAETMMEKCDAGPEIFSEFFAQHLDAFKRRR